MDGYETLEIAREGRRATVRLRRDHGNAISAGLVRDLRAAFGELAGDDATDGVLLAAAGKLFCPGLDLPELVRLERPQLVGFLAEFRSCIHELYAFPKPVVAAMHGHAVAGGLVLALTADWRLLAEQALAGLAEVRVGVPFPYGVSQILRESVSGTRLAEVALFGRNYRGAEALDAGLVHEVRPADGFEQASADRLAELCSKDLTALAITKRYLRSPVLERMEADSGQRDDDFLDAWFSPSTRERLLGVVAELQEKRT